MGWQAGVGKIFSSGNKLAVPFALGYRLFFFASANFFITMPSAGDAGVFANESRVVRRGVPQR